MSNKGYFVISLDFELYWGMFDKIPLAEYAENLEGVHHVVPTLLSLFQSRGIHATWATVGMLMAENKSELLSLLPEADMRPRYKDPLASSYTHIQNAHIGEDAQSDPYHFGRHLVTQITATKDQELASHTFSHFYCLDEVTENTSAFAEDCKAFFVAVAPFNRKITSIVFPRNQTRQSALRTCASLGITTYRGTPDHFLYTAKQEDRQSNLFLRALRLVDAYIPLCGHHTYPLSAVREGSLCNVSGSRFLRPYSRTLRSFETLKIRRIKDSMTHAAKHGEVFHLWWHPHNFGKYRKENMAQLLIILDHFAELQETYGMQSASMADIATVANGSLS